MKPEFRTRDNRTVRFGDHVWAVNGDGPFVITGWLPHSNRSHLQLNLVGGGPSGSMMVHTPEDITFYYFAVEPSAAESDNALAEIRKRAMRNLGL